MSFTPDPKIRAALYWVNTIAVVVLGAIALWFQVSGDSEPSWLDATAEGLLVLGTAFGITAGTNTKGDAIEPSSFPPNWRKPLYWAVGIIQFLILVYSVALRVFPGEQPTWLEFLNALLLFLGGILSGVASSKVSTVSTAPLPAQPEARV